MPAFPFAGDGARRPERVVVRMPNWIGDIVMATPTLAALRAAWPESRLVAAGPGHLGPLLAGAGIVDDTLTLPGKGLGRLASLRASGRLLAEGGFDLALLLTNSVSSALATRLAGIPVRVGHAQPGRGWLLTHGADARGVRSEPALRIPTPERYARLLDHMGVPRGDPAYVLVATEQDTEAARAWRARNGLSDARLIGVHPGGSFGPSKLWSAEVFGRAAATLAERHDARVVVFCGPGEAERALARDIAAATGPAAVAAADDPLDLGGLTGVVKELSLLLTIDSGPRHLGAAFGVPTVVLMGSTDPRLTNTNLGTSLIVRSEVECSPCQRKRCPLTGDATDRCMKEITPAMVVAAAERLRARAG